MKNAMMQLKIIKKNSYFLVFLLLFGGCASAGGKVEDWERERDVENLIRVLSDSTSPHRSQAADALGAIGDSQAVAPLIGVLDEYDRKLQIPVISALGKIGDKKAVDPLIAILRKGYSGLTGPAPGRGKGPPSNVKRKPGGESFDAYQKKILLQAQIRKEAIIALGLIGDRRGVDIISGAVWDGRSHDVSRAAVETLAKMGGEDTAEAFLDAFGTCNFLIRQIAAAALADLMPPPTQILHKTLDDENPCLREGAAQTIGLTGDPQSVGRLIPMLVDENYGVQLQASAALARIGEAAVGPLEEVLDKDNVSARKWACRTLGIIGSARSTPPILRAMEDKTLVVRKAAASALYELAKETPSELLHLLGRLPFAGQGEKILIIKKIARLGDPRAASALKAEARDSDPGVHQAATHALEDISHP